MKKKSDSPKQSTTSKLKKDIQELKLRKQRADLHREVFLSELEAEGYGAPLEYYSEKCLEEQHEKFMVQNGII